MSLRERNKSRTRAEIISLAERIFRERGYESTRMEDIAEAASVSDRTLFNYFDSKNTLLLAIIAERQSAPRKLTPETEEPVFFDARDALPADLEQRIKSAETQRPILAMAAKYAGLYSSEHTQPGVGERNRGFRAKRIKAVQVAGGIRNDIAADEIAELFDIIRFTITRRWLLAPTEKKTVIRTKLDAAIRVFLRGVKPAEEDTAQGTRPNTRKRSRAPRDELRPDREKKKNGAAQRKELG